MSKILVIDDEPNIISILTSRLEANNYDVVAASNGEEGLEKVESESPDLIIVDILMPKMDGLTFVKQVKKSGKEIPIIILTAKPGMKDLFSMEGVKDYVVKPFTAEELLEKIEKHIAKT